MRNEELNKKFDKLVIGQKLKRAVTKYIDRGDMILSIINEIKPAGDYDEDLTKAFTEDELLEVDGLLESLQTIIGLTEPIKEINENIS